MVMVPLVVLALNMHLTQIYAGHGDFPYSYDNYVQKWRVKLVNVEIRALIF